MPLESRGSFSAAVLTLPKLGAAEAINYMIKDSDFAVRINALKAIRKHLIDNFEKDVVGMLLDKEAEVRVAAVKTLSAFGNTKHYELIKTFHLQNEATQPLTIESFVNYSDIYDSYEFMMGQILSSNRKILDTVSEWFVKAFKHDILIPWIIEAYDKSPHHVKRAFEISFAPFLQRLFGDPKYGYRFKLIYILEKENGDY
ncbi:MAG: HEAT repeat domain-containing protein [Campylobacterales bacterium]|nr:HEAT repeat domain-containing protein [Campylobacterales bacterium]